MLQKFIATIAILLISFTGFANARPLLTAGDSVALLNRRAPEFHLKDFHGNIVSLSDYKGKVVVLDFWASWCVPCRQSFPGIAKALNHFADDENVVFLFIDTRETSPDYKKIVKEQMNRDRYPFHVIFDETGPAGLQNQLYLTYGMPGIPTKFIIDVKGIICYQLVGFNPKQSDEENAAELIGVVDRTKAMSN